MKKVSFFFAGITSYMLICYTLLFAIYMIFNTNPFLYYGSRSLQTMYQIKGYINATTIQKPRLLIFSGSNSIYGFDSSIIKENTPFYPINFATNAAVPINFHIDKIIQNAKSGDYVFLPLEFTYYTKTEPKDDQYYIHNMLLWGDGYNNKYISIVSIIKIYISATAPSNIYKVLQPRWRKEQTSIDNPIQQWQEHIKNEGIGHESLNAYGDSGYHEGETKKNIYNTYFTDDIKISNFFISEYKRLESFAKQNNIKI
ncbi:hypothetical protein, partial [Helicobacter sp. CLO-3]|uniref:hypothetical protein n=1 Tax=Helicobacter sp. CLO-3 TaxID=211 RepID=UPI0012E78353